jgi:D-alanyl-D-alanine carboxypeptidase (penicillin-binding protein 5/6)
VSRILFLPLVVLLTLTPASAGVIHTAAPSAHMVIRPVPHHTASARPAGHSTATPAPPTAPAPVPPPAPVPLPASPDIGLQAAAAVLMDQDTGHVMWQAGGHDRRAPASLTKMVTVLVALDHAPLTQQVTVPGGATVFGSESTLMGLSAGEVVTVRELLYGVFLVSGNDAAETFAQTLIPRPQFIAEMNAKVAEMGLSDTHFVNPTGLDAPGQYTSAYDMAVITRYFVQHHPELLAIAGLTDVQLYATPGHSEYDLVNLNKLVLWPYPGATGLKTGFTAAAGGCVAGTASRDGRNRIAIVLGDDVMFSDAGKLFDWGWGLPG